MKSPANVDWLSWPHYLCPILNDALVNMGFVVKKVSALISHHSIKNMKLRGIQMPGLYLIGAAASLVHV